MFEIEILFEKYITNIFRSLCYFPGFDELIVPSDIALFLFLPL
jgi:hypothetical protein